MQDKIAGVENAGLKNDGHEFDGQENDGQRHRTNAMKNHLCVKPGFHYPS